MSKPPLPVGSIACALFSRGDGTFHWALVIPTDTKNVVKLHATNIQGPWVYEKVNHALDKSVKLCVVVKIGASIAVSHVPTCLILS